LPIPVPGGDVLHDPARRLDRPAYPIDTPGITAERLHGALAKRRATNAPMPRQACDVVSVAFRKWAD